ncbi:MAG: FAD:protein FMN transferase [Candidatus Aminicenantes bacterium]|nr:FAD:protein FMN transferase [Candidatus Aminicenantes bacterium]
MNESFPAVPHFSHEAMSTIFEIFIPDPDASYAEQAARAAFREIDRLEGLFSRFDPGSEISRINRLPEGREIPVGIETFECLSLAEAVRVETGGAFDINARAAAPPGVSEYPDPFPNEPAPFSAGFELVGESGSYAIRRPAASGLCGFPVLHDPWESGPAYTTIGSQGAGPPEIPRLDLDLGGVGKGYALDQAAKILLEWGVSDALLHGGMSSALAAGSPLAKSGTDPESKLPARPGWPVGVGAGWPGAPTRVVLSGRALSGSGTEVKGGHILDPRTGRPARGNLAAWASAPTAALSDALSTAFFVMTPDAVEAFVGRHPDIWACLVVSYGDIRIWGQITHSPISTIGE